MPNGEPVPEMNVLAPSAGYDPLRSTFAIWIERWMDEMGIPLRANLTGFNLIVEKVFDQQDFDMWILGWSLSLYPDYLEAFFHSRHSDLEEHNAGGYNNPGVRPTGRRATGGDGPGNGSSAGLPDAGVSGRRIALRGAVYHPYS